MLASKFARLGKMPPSAVSDTPNQRPSVAPSWSTDTSGSKAPLPNWSGLLSKLLLLLFYKPTVGKRPYRSPPFTAPPMTRWWLPQPWSVPSPLLVKVRPKSLAVKVVTLLRAPSVPRLVSK